MYSLVNSNFNRTYNPSGKHNALADIKRLLTSRHTEAQNKACGYLIEVISRYNKNDKERSRMVDYLLENDVTVFLCEATSNLDFSLFRLFKRGVCSFKENLAEMYRILKILRKLSVLACLRLLWRERRFFAEEHATHAMSAVMRAVPHYAGSGASAAVDVCLHFLCDLLDGVSSNQTTPPLSHQSAYSAEQLLACLNSLAPRINTNPKSVISSALVLHALVSYQPDNLALRGSTAASLAEVLKNWFGLLLGALNHAMLVGDTGVSEMAYVVVCQLGMAALGLTKCLHREKQNVDFVQSILTDDQEIGLLKESAFEMGKSIQHIVSELVVFTKENLGQITSEEYSVFLKFLLCFFYENARREVLYDFCDMLFSKNYLTMLPHAQIARNDVAIRKVSTLILGEMLKVLSNKYLNFDDSDLGGDNTHSRDIQMGLVELQYGIERPQSIGAQLQKGQPYSLLIYIYFYCQSLENPEEATASLLPHLVEHVLRLPGRFKPPPYIVKALWLVFAMSAVSNCSLKSLDERVYLERATDRVVGMLHPDPSVYYTHNPAILLWSFTSQRIPNYVRIHVLSQWLQAEDCIPSELTTIPTVWELLLTILVRDKNATVVENCTEALHTCLEEATEEDKQKFAAMVWAMLPNALSKTLIDYETEIDPNICHLLDLATTLLPSEVDQTVCLKTAVLITTIFSKKLENTSEGESKYYYEYVCLKLSLYLLRLADNNNDNRVLLTFTNRAGFLPRVLSAAHSAHERVACAALQLLSYVAHYFTRNHYQPKSVLQIETHCIIKSLRQDSTSERGACLLQLVYTVLNSGAQTALVLAQELDLPPSVGHQCTALRALMLRIQLMLCCRDSENQTPAGWKTLSSIFKYAIVSKNDTKLVATLTSQPWTHTLIQFQLTQKVTLEFLTFTQNWLTLLKITLKKSQGEKRRHLSKDSLIVKTLLSLKKNLKLEGDTAELRQKTIVIVKEIIEDSGIPGLSYR